MMRTHRVLYGETLSTIAMAYYHDPGKWAIIFQHNSHYLPDPNHLDPGQILVIPHLGLPGLVEQIFSS